MKRCLVLIAAALLGACASSIGRLPALPAPAVGYLLGPGDTLHITVFGESDFTGTYKISEGGAIFMPLLGAIPADGVSVDEFTTRLAAKLESNAFRSADLTVQVAEYRPFFILGEVKTPGSYPYMPNMTVLTAVAIAGGFTYRAYQEEVSVTRTVDGRSLEARANRANRVLPGDVVYVAERHL